MSKKDYYEVLGLAKNASDDEIKKSYRKLAMQYHPDRNQESGAEDKFKEAKEAYETLSDPAKKIQYDQFGHVSPNSHGNSKTWNFNNNDNVDFKELFKHMFNGQTIDESFNSYRQPRQQISVVTIPLSDAYKGITVTIDQKHTVNLPQGVRSGTKFSIDGKLFRVDVSPHNRFKRSNDDLLVDVEITAIEAMLGVESLLEHLDHAKLQFNIPAGIQNGQIIRLFSKGMKNPETDGIGDLLIRITVTIPKLSDSDKEMLKKLSHRDIINI